MTIATKIFTRLRGKLVGTDEFGNRYFEDRKLTDGKRKRWVVYNGRAEASKVPASWHGWLHYTTDKVLTDKYDWQKSHIPNLTGTENAYLPAGHPKKGGVRKKATGDYEAWNPEA